MAAGLAKDDPALLVRRAYTIALMQALGAGIARADAKHMALLATADAVGRILGRPVRLKEVLDLLDMSGIAAMQNVKAKLSEPSAEKGLADANGVEARA